MSSIRRNLRPEDNVNGSKNTRMDVSSPLSSWKPDEIGHITRYTKIAELIIKESRNLGRPISLLEIGCGNVWVLRHIYKSMVIRKDDFISEYIGYDIDPAVLDEIDGWPQYNSVNESKWFECFNGHVEIQDMTTNPIMITKGEYIPDEYFDFFWSTETIEHMGREFVEPWIADATRTLRSGGLAYISTPNHDGSRDRLPEDHIYEWGHLELKELLEKYFHIEEVHGIFTQIYNFKRAHMQHKRWPDSVIEDIKKRFSPEFQRVILATVYPETSNNAAFVLRKK